LKNRVEGVHGTKSSVDAPHGIREGSVLLRVAERSGGDAQCPRDRSRGPFVGVGVFLLRSAGAVEDAA
jgi:hypothetical protein